MLQGLRHVRRAHRIWPGGAWVALAGAHYPWAHHDPCRLPVVAPPLMPAHRRRLPHCTVLCCDVQSCVCPAAPFVLPEGGALCCRPSTSTPYHMPCESRVVPPWFSVMYSCSILPQPWLTATATTPLGGAQGRAPPLGRQLGWHRMQRWGCRVESSEHGQQGHPNSSMSMNSFDWWHVRCHVHCHGMGMLDWIVQR